MIEKPEVGKDYPSRIAEVRSWFPTDELCLDYLDWLRWPNGFVCPHCGKDSAGRDEVGRYRCHGCRRRGSVTSGTIFDRSRTPLSVWFEAAWLMTTAKNGISAATLSNVLPLGSYQTAWTMLAKYRATMSTAEKSPLSGTVEVDEWVQGGRQTREEARRQGSNKNLVAGAVEHSAKGYGRIRLRIIEDSKAPSLRDFITGNVELGSHIITDGWRPYTQATAGFLHEPRNESGADAEPGHTLLPGVHRVFSLAERWLLGTHQGGVHPTHLQEYLDEFTFRWNRRNASHRGLLFFRLLEHAVTAEPVCIPIWLELGPRNP